MRKYQLIYSKDNMKYMVPGEPMTREAAADYISGKEGQYHITLQEVVCGPKTFKEAFSAIAIVHGDKDMDICLYNTNRKFVTDIPYIVSKRSDMEFLWSDANIEIESISIHEDEVIIHFDKEKL